MKYKVRDPAGDLQEIEAPEGASDAEIIAIAQQAKSPKPASPSAPESPSKPSIASLAKPEILGGLGEAIEKLGYRSGGAVTDAAAKVLPPEVAAAAGYGTNLATQAAATFAGAGIGKAAEPVMQAGARKLMQSALKPGTASLANGKAARAIDTMLQEGINVTPGGVMKMKGMIDDLGKEINQAIASSSGTVNKNDVATSLQMALNKFERQVNPKSDSEAIYKAWNEFLSHPMLAGKTDMPVQVAQQLKQGTYAQLGNKNYGELKGAEIEAQKTLAKGLRQEIEKAVPEIAKLNAQQSNLLNAKLLAEARVLVNPNRDPGGIGLFFANHPATAIGWIASRNPWLKSILARGLYKGGPTAGAAAGGSFGAEMGTSE